MKGFEDDLRAQLAEQLRGDLKVEAPQMENEFTVSWFAKYVMLCGTDCARRRLETLVKENKMAVRRRVLITWTVGTPRGTLGDVYRYVGGKELRGKLQKKSSRV